mgnify:FL=1
MLRLINQAAVYEHGGLMQRFVYVLPLLVLLAVFSGCGKAPSRPAISPASDFQVVSGNGKLVFIELGSVNCVPCQAMQPVMEEVKKRYPSEVEVRFHDVWTKEGQPYGSKYGIRVIPTQVFLNKSGKEYFRHEGFFPLEEVLKVLEQGGLKL